MPRIHVWIPHYGKKEEDIYSLNHFQFLVVQLSNVNYLMVSLKYCNNRGKTSKTAIKAAGGGRRRACEFR